MKKKITHYLILLFGISTLIIGCKKEPGPAGADGSSNVTSTIFNINTWYTTTSPYNHHYVDLSVSELTSSNINSSAVMAYINTGDNVWTAIPYTEYDFPSDYHMGFKTGVGNVELTWFYDGSGFGSDPNALYGFTVQAKVVVIPPAAMQANSDLDLKNYEAVKKRFNLRD